MLAARHEQIHRVTTRTWGTASTVPGCAGDPREAAPLLTGGPPEPPPGMRAVLLSRLSSHPELAGVALLTALGLMRIPGVVAGW